MMINELPESTRLIQLAEEAAELSQASLKLVRALNGQTPVTEDDARLHLSEEIADVLVCVAALSVDMTTVNDIAQWKAERWGSRLNREADMRGV